MSKTKKFNKKQLEEIYNCNTIQELNDGSFNVYDDLILNKPFPCSIHIMGGDLHLFEIEKEFDFMPRAIYGNLYLIGCRNITRWPKEVHGVIHCFLNRADWQRKRYGYRHRNGIEYSFYSGDECNRVMQHNFMQLKNFF